MKTETEERVVKEDDLELGVSLNDDASLLWQCMARVRKQMLQQ